MKITEQHVSEALLNAMIQFYENEHILKEDFLSLQFMNALLELKQRRAVDRQREANNGNAS